MKEDGKQRQELVAAIERGDFIRNRKVNNSGKILAILISLCVLAFLAGVISSSPAVFGAVVFVLAVPVVIYLASMGPKTTAGAKLDSLTETQRWLILNGEKIEADIESINHSENKSVHLYNIVCTAKYHGQDMKFATPDFCVKPIPFEKRKITVYINPESPEQYFVNFYSNLPHVGINALRDRSGLKCEPVANISEKPKKTATAIIVVVFIPLMVFLGIVTLLMVIASGNVLGAFVVLGIPLVMACVVWWTMRNHDNTNKLLTKGYYVVAKGQYSWRAGDEGALNNLIVRYIEPNTKLMHEFQTVGPKSVENLVGVKVRVYVNPDNLAEYYVDVQTSLKELGFTASRLEKNG